MKIDDHNDESYWGSGQYNDRFWSQSHISTRYALYIYAFCKSSGNLDWEWGCLRALLPHADPIHAEFDKL